MVTIPRPVRQSQGETSDLASAEGQHRSQPIWWNTVKSAPWVIKIAMMILVGIIGIALFAPVVTPHDPVEQDLLARLSAPSTGDGMASSYLLGADALGRDVLSRIIHGARISLAIALYGTVVGMILGTTVGLLADLNRGAVDHVVMFLVDAQQALPFIIIALAAIAIYGTDLWVLLTLVGLAGWEGYARFSRGMTLSVRQTQYVLASRAMGASQARILVRHVLPNVAAPLIVIATLNITGIILLESSLSFLGIGVQPPTPSWGSMIGEGRAYLSSAWWIAVFPGLTVVLVTVSVNLFGDWLRDVLDPTVKGRL